MNKREAKKNACFHASQVLRNALDGGWKTRELVESDEDEKRLVDALFEIIHELRIRGVR